ncbi:MAG: hypothetical protein HYW48_01865 [Deltaproteobacteria bacterium]|nr:hypothetical protein [Deltaproteobacteria bacterium]
MEEPAAQFPPNHLLAPISLRYIKNCENDFRYYLSICKYWAIHFFSR